MAVINNMENEKQGISSRLPHCNYDRIVAMSGKRISEISSQVLRESNWDEYSMARSWEMARVSTQQGVYKTLLCDIPFEVLMTPIRYVRYNIYKNSSKAA
jgi:hypothetical protein